MPGEDRIALVGERLQRGARGKPSIDVESTMSASACTPARARR
jgi:hypothetical protein